MSLQYSGGTLINRTFSPASRGDWVNNVTQALSDAGWATIAGVPGSGSDVKLETAANNVGAKTRMRFLDPGSGNCAQVTMKNVAETLTSQIAYALPSAGSGQWRIVANKFHFIVFPTGAANALAARGCIEGGTLYTPTFWGPPTVDFGWLLFVGANDTDTQTRISFRRSLRRFSSGGNADCVGFSQIIGANLVDLAAGQGVGFYGPSMPSWTGACTRSNETIESGYRWEDNTLLVYEPLLAWFSTNNTANEGKIKGQLYDACVISSTFSGWVGEATFALDGHTWIVITDAVTNTYGGQGALALAIT